MRPSLPLLLCLALGCATQAAGVVAPSTASRSDYLLSRLDLHLESSSPMLTPKLPTASIVFRAYQQFLQSRPTIRRFMSLDKDTLAQEQLARRVESNGLAASTRSGACLSHQGNDDVGAGISWSLRNGFGMYWQGKGMRELQHLVGFDDANEICPPGDPSPMCRSMPKSTCD
jgi:hypothetical protein